MSLDLEISLSVERLDEGSAGELATFGMFAIRSPLGWLTEGFDSFIDGYRHGPLVPGSHAAEWMAWNWWRLRWEPRSASADWALAHCLTSIGEGYVWPNLTIFSDGVRTALLSSPSTKPTAKPFRYVGAMPLVLPSSSFEHAIDEFMSHVLSRLCDHQVTGSNVSSLWSDVLNERSNPSVARYRRLEALLGRDSDALDDGLIDRLLGDASALGEAAIDEVAAEHALDAGRRTSLISAADFRELADARGFQANSRDAVTIDKTQLPRRDAVPAWRLGADAAKILRSEQGLGSAPISDHRLAAMAGASKRLLSRKSYNASPISFLYEAKGNDRIVLRSKWETGRRFELARIVGDNLLEQAGALHPATRTFTYRQKAQRAFAAELLSPFDAVDEMLAGDYSNENQQEVAEHFVVSTMTINTALKNHKRINRDDFEEDFSDKTQIASGF